MGRYVEATLLKKYSQDNSEIFDSVSPTTGNFVLIEYLPRVIWNPIFDISSV